MTARMLNPAALSREGTLPGTEAFRAWQRTNPYYGKRFSVLGTSISTLEGWNPPGHSVFYKGDIRLEAGVSKPEDTWWGQIIEFFGGELLVNDSWSGSRVTAVPGRETLYPSACSEERCGSLHRGDLQPDVILVDMGGNDWGVGAAPTRTDGEAPNGEPWLYFDEAYERMLQLLKEKYPAAELWCWRLGETYRSANPAFAYDFEAGGYHQGRYNEIIDRLCARHGCRVIHELPFDTVDGVHPNARGMRAIALSAIRVMAGAGAEFLNSPEEDPERPAQNN